MITKISKCAIRCTFLGILLLNSFASNAQQPGDKKKICKQSVPSGWITTHVGDPCEPGLVFGLENYARDIVYYEGLPTGSKLFLSADIKPSGWIKTSKSIGPAIPAIINGKLGTSIYYNNDILKVEGMPTGSKVDMVDDIAPDGWVWTGVKFNPTSIAPQDYYATITRYDGLPPGSTLTILSPFVPIGWVATDMGTTKLGNLSFDTRKIIRLDGLNSIDEITIVGSFPPSGWITIGMGTKVVGNQKVLTRRIKKISTLDPKKEYSFYDGAMPDGWIQTDFGANNTGIGIYNYKLAKNYKNAAPGDKITIIDARPPQGWVTIGVGGRFFISTIYQTRTIEKLEGFDSLNEITIVDEIQPDGWMPVSMGSVFSVATIYETRKIIRTSSMDPTKQYSMATTIPPVGWFITGITTQTVGTRTYEIFKISNYYNMPVGKKITVIDDGFAPTPPPDGWTTISTGKATGLFSVYTTYYITKKQNRINGEVSGTWTKAGNPWVINGEVIIQQDKKLTIGPGVEVQTYSVNDRITVNGTLIANGTATDSILFRGLRNPGDQSRPGGYVTFNATSKNSILNFVSIDKWGDDYQEQNAINILSSSVTITNSMIKNSSFTGINIHDDYVPIITNNNFSGNKTAIETKSENLLNATGNRNANIKLISSTILNNKSTLKNQGPGSYYFFRALYQVNYGSTLTIDPGTEIRWTGNSRAYPDIFNVYGTLIAKGTDKDSIRFTGNDRWRTDMLVSPPGHLLFSDSSKNNVIDHVVIDKMGTAYTEVSGEYGAISTYTPSLTVTNCLIKNSASVGITNDNNGYEAVVTNNSFYNNSKDIVTTLAGSVKTRNNTNAKIVLLDGPVRKNIDLPLPGLNSYYQLRDLITVPQNITLNIAPGTLFDFGNIRGGLNVSGTLKAKGTSQLPIKFVRLKPEAASTGDFGITLNYPSKNSELEYLNIDGGGNINARSGALTVYNQNFMASNLSITNSTYAGIVCTADRPVITKSVIKNNKIGIQSWHCSPTFKDCEISGNIDYGIQTVTNYPDTVDARYVSWGDPSGPFHKTLNPKGKGNQVTDKVWFLPYKVGNKLGQQIQMDSVLTRRYGDADLALNVSVSSGLIPVFKISDPSIASIDAKYNLHIKGAGSTLIQATQKGDATYAPADTVILKLTVNKASLTITADNKARYYGDADPLLTVAYNGFVNGDSPKSLKTLPSISAATTSLSSPGNYPIAVSGAVSPNYDITYVAGTFTIKPAPAPTIASITPGAAIEGSQVTIKGAYFSNASEVSFGDVPAASFKVVSSSVITAVVAKGGSGNVSVTTPSGKGSITGFVFVPMPVISAGGPLDLQSGGSVTLSSAGVAGLTYQWNKDGKPISGANATNFTANQSGSYTLSISNAGVVQTSQPLVVNVVFSLPPDNFKFSNTGVSCKGSTNGSINISAKVALNYTAILNGPATNNKTYNFTDKLVLADLAPGSYNICITAAEQPNYQQCFTSVITEPADLSVYSSITPGTTQLLLSMQGAQTYNISLNDQLVTTSNSQITLKLQPGTNTLKVSTDKLCQGVFQKIITLIKNAPPYPNPFTSTIKLDAGTDLLKNATLIVFDMTNKVVYKRNYAAVSGVIETDLSSLKSGVYILKLACAQKENVYKVIKH
ncbi:MBG domain-containing protein [Mucilaginibacter celer]|uniref:T9SS C-terminal target domain-containing protein n=1 Tax=Mucilaginibacter celer TaxID=2305508 RepID=A0A494VNI9_9SPHI|nr:MBG domain-containing protein [Mucilaginibacter celer]AYL95749.1 T9SS C-terminal target domain-containing protein [Mucilaginibacter celer]